MALPVAHSMIGLALGIWRFVPRCAGLQQVFQIAWQRRVELFVCILIANASDIDLLFGMFTGSLNRYHQLGTHTLGWVLITAVVIWLYGKFALNNHPGLAFGFVFLLLGSHLMIDIFTADTTPPHGIMFAWPFASGFWYSPLSIFPAPAKKNLMDIFSLPNLKNAGREFLILLPVLAATLLLKVCRLPRNQPTPIADEAEK